MSPLIIILLLKLFYLSLARVAHKQKCDKLSCSILKVFHPRSQTHRYYELQGCSVY